jgi:hypothetical protein
MRGLTNAELQQQHGDYEQVSVIEHPAHEFPAPDAQCRLLDNCPTCIATP